MNEYYEEQVFKLRGTHPESVVPIFSGLVLLVIALICGIEDALSTISLLIMVLLGVGLIFFGFKLNYSGKLILGSDGIWYRKIFIPWKRICGYTAWTKPLKTIPPMTFKAVSLRINEPEEFISKLSHYSKFEQRAWFTSLIQDDVSDVVLHQSEEFFLILTNSDIEPEELIVRIEEYLEKFGDPL